MFDEMYSARHETNDETQSPAVDTFSVKDQCADVMRRGELTLCACSSQGKALLASPLGGPRDEGVVLDGPSFHGVGRMLSTG